MLNKQKAQKAAMPFMYKPLVSKTAINVATELVAKKGQFRPNLPKMYLIISQPQLCIPKIIYLAVRGVGKC